MKLNIKTKILLNGVLSVVISIMLVTVILSLLLWDQSETQARHQINHAAEVIKLKVRETEAELTEIAVKIGNQQEYANRVNFIQENAGNNALSDMLEGERRELASSVYEVALTSQVPWLAVYDVGGYLICSVSLKNDLARIRYLSVQNKPVIREAVIPLGEHPRTEQWGENPEVRPDQFRHRSLPSQPETGRDAREGRLWLTAVSPLRAQILSPETLKEEMVQKGLTEVSRDMDDAFIQSLCNLTDTRINLFIGSALSVGALPSYSYPDQEILSRFRALSETASYPEEMFYKNIHVGKEAFFEGLAPVFGTDRFIGFFSVLLSQKETREAQWRMIRSLILVALICILIVTPLTWFLAIREIIERERMQAELARHRDHLEELVGERTRELAQANESLDQKNIRLNETLSEVEKANTEITESIRYARTIQQSLVTDQEKIKRFLPESFFIWIPCEIVSGDIFHFDAFEEGFIVAVIDCTGHGVPGAFMTMLAISAMRRITRTEKCRDPGEILKRLNYTIRKMLQQDTNHALSDDGMDAAICFVPGEGSEVSEIIFAGARLSLIWLHKGELTHIKGDKQSLGYKNSDPDFNFANHTIPVAPGDSFYMASDGLTDQLGGEKGIRFGTRRLKNLIKENGSLSFDKQCDIFVDRFNEYRGENPLQDDVTVVGFALKYEV